MIDITTIFNSDEGINISSLKTVLYDIANKIEELESVEIVNTVYNEEKDLKIDLLENENGLKMVHLDSNVLDDASVFIYCDAFEDGEFRSVPISSTFIFSIEKNSIIFNHRFNHLKYSKMFITYNV